MVFNAIFQNVAETVHSERNPHAVKQQQASDFTRRLNATLRTVPPGPTSPLVDVDWTRNVMITVLAGAEDNRMAATAGGLANCSRCTFAHMCEAADNPGDCHWCQLSSGSYCENNGTACRVVAEPQQVGDATQTVALHARLVAAVHAAAVLGVGAPAALALPSEETIPAFVSKIGARSSRHAGADSGDTRSGSAGTSQTTYIYTFRLPNEEGMTVQEHAWWRHLPVALKEAGLPTARTYF